MRNIKNIFVLLIGFLFSTILLANNEPVEVMKKEGNKKEVAVMYSVVDGSVKLFYEPTEVTEFTRTGEYDFTAIATQEIDIFYIGTNEEVEQINAGNYKRLIKKHLPNALELHKRLGKRGFRFENVPSMVLYYNKRVIGNKVPLSKTDIYRPSAS